MKSLHLIGSKNMGGAERWFTRFMHAMVRHGEPVEAVVRRGSELAVHHLADLPHRELPFRTVWDPLTRFEVARLLKASDAPIVQTYMGRATRLTHLGTGPRQGPCVAPRRLQARPLPPCACLDRQHQGLCDWMIRAACRQRGFSTSPTSPTPPERCRGRLAALRARIRLGPDDWLIVTAGRLIDVKGHRFLVEAMGRPAGRDRWPAAAPGGAGRRNLRSSLEEQARQLGAAERILWAGWQHDPAPWFSIADMVVFPSRDEETLGNVILEAWAYGKPLVASAFRGAREITRHGEDAWWCPVTTAQRSPTASSM